MGSRFLINPFFSVSSFLQNKTEIIDNIHLKINIELEVLYPEKAKRKKKEKMKSLTRHGKEV